MSFKQRKREAAGKRAMARVRARRQARRYRRRLARRREDSSEKRTNKRTRAAKRANRRVRTNQGNKVRLAKDGYVASRNVRRRGLTARSAERLNKVIDRKGRHLTAGKNRAVVGQRTIRFRDEDGNRTKQTVNVYGRVGQRNRQNERQSGSSSSGSGSSGSSSSRSGSSSSRSSSAPSTVGNATGNYATVERLEQEAPEQPNFYDTANSFPQNPNFSPTGVPGVGSGGSNPIYWDRTGENLLSYSDRLGGHNRETGQWLSNIAAQDRKESSAYLNNFARSLPKAPDPNESNESVLNFLEQANKRLGFRVA